MTQRHDIPIIVNEVQTILDAYSEDYEIDLWEMIDESYELTEEQKEWARGNLGVALVVTVLSPWEDEDGY